MKYRWIFVLSIGAALILAFAAGGAEPERNRYHQHLEAAEKAPCTDHDESVFCTHLPLMEITTDGPVPEPYLYDAYDGSLNPESNRLGRRRHNNEMVAASVRYFDSETENNHLTDTPVVENRALFRIRGTSSRSFDKKGYLLKFVKEDMVRAREISLSGMSSDSSWVLHGPFLDKTLIRNYLCYNLAGEMMDYAPNVRFCELFVNGEYMGLYLLIEKIGYDGNGRINITKTDPKMSVTSYILQIDRGASDPSHDLETFGSYGYLTRLKEDAPYGHMEVIYPGKSLTEAQAAYIAADISQFEKALFSYDYADPDRGYRRYIDVQSFIDFFLINEFTLNYDAPVLSTYVYKDIGGKLKTCIWDFNAVFDYYEYSSISPVTFRIQSSFWYQMLFKDEAFVNQVKSRYWQLRKRLFNEEYLFSYIDDTIAYLGPAIDRNFEKWGYSFQSVYNGVSYDFLKPADRNVRSYEEAVQQLKSCITQRIEHMDRNLDRLYSLCHLSLNKKYNHNPEGGYGS